MWFFFFKQKTAYEMRISEWSSDVCSSDLRVQGEIRRLPFDAPHHGKDRPFGGAEEDAIAFPYADIRPRQPQPRHRAGKGLGPRQSRAQPVPAWPRLDLGYGFVYGRFLVRPRGALNLGADGQCRPAGAGFG